LRKEEPTLREENVKYLAEEGKGNIPISERDRRVQGRGAIDWTKRKIQEKFEKRPIRIGVIGKRGKASANLRDNFYGEKKRVQS